MGTNSEKFISKLKWLKKLLNLKVIIALVIIISIASISIGIGVVNFSESKTQKIGFENIGELATQSSYCTEVNVTEDYKTLFGMTIPFTQSKYIYSYDVLIKAGFDFNEVEWQEKGKTIEVKLPKAKILSSDINMDSFKIYHESESIFSPITLTDNNEALKKLKKTAEENSIENGLLENARYNAEAILKGFFGNVYDLKAYKLIFLDK